MRHVDGEMGARAEGSGLHELDMPDAVGLQELPEVRQGPQSPLLAVAARRVRPTAVRAGAVPRRCPRQAASVHRRLAGAQPDGVPALPLVSGIRALTPASFHSISFKVNTCV
jgi:hypothetical protein